MKDIFMEDLKIKEWYLKEYPDDEVGEELYDDITFYDLFEAMDKYKNVYEFLGGFDIDTIVRERIFIKLAEIMNVDYDYVYEQWLKCIG